MPRRRRVPAYQRHKHSGQAFVKLNGEFIYLGPYGTKVSRAEYDRVVGEWLASGRRPMIHAEGEPDLLICELCAAYWEFAQAYYRKNGRPTKEQPHVRNLLQRFNRLYGKVPVSEFGPLALKGFRQILIEEDLSRTYIQDQIGRVKRIFKWGVENELVTPPVFEALRAVAGLRKGRSAARETAPVRPVAAEHVKAIRRHVSRQVYAIVELQLLTGMRSGEVVNMRGCDLDMTGDTWEYRPREHKTQHHHEEKVIPLGPRAQQIIRPFLKPDTEAYLFSPADAEAERRARMHAERKTPPCHGNGPGTNRKRKPKRVPGERYTTDSLRRAVQRGCRLAFPAPDGLDAEQSKQWHKDHRWFPHQIRHTRGTEVRKMFGLEGAQMHLGHSKANTTEIYAERNLELAREIARQIG